LTLADDMDTTYAGIDYGSNRSNLDTETGIRFGVISQNSIMPEAFDDVWTQARDLTYERAVENAKTEFGDMRHEDELTDWIHEHLVTRENAVLWAEAILIDYTTEEGIILKMDVGVVEHIWGEVEQDFNDAYSMNDCGDRDWLYESDGYKLTNCLHTDVFVLNSPYFTYAQFCSPCVPGACNLNSPLVTPPDDVYGGNNFEDDWQKIRANRCYCLGHDWFEDGRAPYPVYSVETGELVASVVNA
jgi:hypothetical protein